MDLRKLGYLRLVIAHGSFAAAARAAGVSQPAITQAMQSLEREAGAPLFVRSGRRKLPTAAALLAAQRAAELQGRLDDMHAAVREAPAVCAAGFEGMLHVAMAPTAGLLFGGVVEQAWRAQRPDGLLHIVGGNAADMLTALQRGELDLALAPRPWRYQAEKLKRHLLFTSTPTICARIGHPLASATSLNDIADARWASAGRVGTSGSLIEEALRVRRLPPPRMLMRCADYVALLNVVARSDLLCSIPHPALLRGIAHPGVAPLRVREGLPRYEVCVFWRTDAPGAMRDVIAHVVQALKKAARQAGANNVWA
jgi:DNA-binding transcriptional LysR family regulator